MEGGAGQQQAYHGINRGPCWEQAGGEGNECVCTGDGGACVHTHVCAG